MLFWMLLQTLDLIKIGKSTTHSQHTSLQIYLGDEIITFSENIKLDLFDHQQNSIDWPQKSSGENLDLWIVVHIRTVALWIGLWQI